MTTLKVEVDAGQLSTASTSNGDNQVMEKNDTIAAVDGEGKTEFFYLKGWRLWAIMGTLYLNTLLAALDIVSTTTLFCTSHILQKK